MGNIPVPKLEFDYYAADTERRMQIERRSGLDRRKDDRRKANIPVKFDRRKGERRSGIERRQYDRRQEE